MQTRKDDSLNSANFVHTYTKACSCGSARRQYLSPELARGLRVEGDGQAAGEEPCQGQLPYQSLHSSTRRRLILLQIELPGRGRSGNGLISYPALSLLTV